MEKGILFLLPKRRGLERLAISEGSDAKNATKFKVRTLAFPKNVVSVNSLEPAEPLIHTNRKKVGKDIKKALKVHGPTIIRYLLERIERT